MLSYIRLFLNYLHMKHYTQILFLFTCIILFACKQSIKNKSPLPESAKNLIVIENGGTRIGILKEVGSTVVFFQKDGSENLLESDPKLWNEPDSTRPKVTPFTDWKAYNGHTVWLGPQSQWWTQQASNQTRKNEKAVWPPDPYLILADYDVIEQTETSLKLKSPKSPVSGVCLTKEISIDKRGKVNFTATATNIREEEVSWDLWMNTRVNGYARVYVKSEPFLPNRTSNGVNETTDSVDYVYNEGFFTFHPAVPRNGKKEAFTKAFLFPEKSFIAAFDKGFMFLIRIHEFHVGQLHNEQALVELYNLTTPEGKNTLLELEHHGPYLTLKPGESMSLTETWEAIPYKGKDTDNEHIDFINKRVK